MSTFPHSYALSPFSTHVCCRDRSNFSTLLDYIYFLRCCPMSTLSTVLRNIYSFNTAAPCLLFPRYYSMLLCHVYLFHTLMHCLLFHAVARYLLLPKCCTISTLPRCCAMSSLSILLRHVHFFHPAAPCQSSLSTKLRAMSTFPLYCAMSTLSMLLRIVYFFHGAAPHLLLQHCCSTSPFSTLLRHVCFAIAVL